MVYFLKDRVVLISGSSAGLGAELARAFAAEGCHLVLNHSSNSESSVARAKATEESLKSEFPNTKVKFVVADCAVSADNVRLVKEAILASQEWGFEGRLDGIIANAGWTRFSDIADLSAPFEEDFDKCFAVNVKSPWILLREAAPVMKSNPDGGFMLFSSSVAGENPAGSSLPYCVSKAANLHLMTCMAAHQSPKIRINAVKPGVLPTDWGYQFGEERYNQMIESSRLKVPNTLENCALIYVMLAKNNSVTGESITIDGGSNL
ncbi:hypothetical protein V1511DRAFT_498113 [Dipodascopsis uninucleata]